MGIVPPSPKQIYGDGEHAFLWPLLSSEFQWKLIMAKNQGKRLELRGRRALYLPVPTIAFVRFLSLPVRKLMRTEGRWWGGKCVHTLEFLRGMFEFARARRTRRMPKIKSNNETKPTQNTQNVPLFSSPTALFARRLIPNNLDIPTTHEIRHQTNLEERFLRSGTTWNLKSQCTLQS